MRCIIDIQFCVGNNKSLIPKQMNICYLDCEKNSQCITFKIPYELLIENFKINKWIYLNLNKLHYNDGNENLNEFSNKLFDAVKGCSTIYTKGFQKQQFISFYIPLVKVIDVTTIGCPSIQKLLYKSYSPKNQYGYNIVLNIKVWIINYEQSTNRRAII